MKVEVEVVIWPVDASISFLTNLSMAGAGMLMGLEAGWLDWYFLTARYHLAYARNVFFHFLAFQSCFSEETPQSCFLTPSTAQNNSPVDQLLGSAALRKHCF